LQFIFINFDFVYLVYLLMSLYGETDCYGWNKIMCN